MASYSITGNQLKCLNYQPNQELKTGTHGDDSFAGFRAWGTITTTDNPTYVRVTCTPYFTYGNNSYAPTGSVTGKYEIILDGTVKSTSTFTKTVSSPYARYDLSTVTFDISKTHSSASHTVQFKFTRTSDTMKRYAKLLRTNTYPVTWANNTTNPASDDTGSVSVSLGHATFTVPAKASYTVSYNANGGTSTPSSQTKWYGEALTLRGAISRTGYTFAGWNTNSSGTGTNYNASGSYTANSGATLYAKWTANKYTVSYNNNGGIGTIASQTKTYGTALTLSNNPNKAMTKTDTLNGAVREYLIKSTGGWNTKADGTGTAFNLGGSMGANAITANTTLYAQWEKKYIYPTITNAAIIRTDTVYSTAESDDGEYIYITFGWTGYSENANASTPTFSTPTAKITVNNVVYNISLTSGTNAYRPVKASTDTTAHVEKSYYTRGDTEPSSGTYTFVYPYYYTLVESVPTGANPSSLGWYEFLTYSQDATHTVVIELYDPNYTTSKATQTLVVATAILPIDLYGAGENVYMGIMHPYETGTPLVLPDTKIDGMATEKGISSPNGTYREIYTDITQAMAKTYNSSLTSSSSDSDWMQAYVKAICALYPNKTNVVFKGQFRPNSMGWYEVLIYDTSVVSNGLPRYSFGTIRKYTMALEIFSTSEYAWSFASK